MSHRRWYNRNGTRRARPCRSTGRHPYGDRTGCCSEAHCAGPDTSCPFAQNVEANYTGLGADYAYSPVTGENYTMNCVAGYGNLNGGDSVVCTGGNNDPGNHVQPPQQHRTRRQDVISDHLS